MITKTRETTGILKNCIKCENKLDTSLFNKNKQMKSGLDSACWECRKKEAKLFYWKNVERQRLISKAYARTHKDKVFSRKANNPEKYLCMLAKSRAKRENLIFNLTPENIIIPEYCPVLGMKLEFSYGKHATDASPTIDKFIPDLGYVPGNVAVISKKANRLKGDAYLIEIEALVKWMEQRVEEMLK